MIIFVVYLYLSWQMAKYFLNYTKPLHSKSVTTRPFTTNSKTGSCTVRDTDNFVLNLKRNQACGPSIRIKLRLVTIVLYLQSTAMNYAYSQRTDFQNTYTPILTVLCHSVLCQLISDVTRILWYIFTLPAVTYSRTALTMKIQYNKCGTGTNKQRGKEIWCWITQYRISQICERKVVFRMK
jgi:hypothetical protein